MFCTGNGQYDTRKAVGGDYRGISGAEIVALVRKPSGAPKEQAQWIIPSTYRAFDARAHDRQREAGEFCFLPLDVDQNNLALDDLKAAMAAVAGDCAVLIYSTRSATAENRKWRALVPLKWPLPGADYHDTVEAFNDLLEDASSGAL